jgi:hypothetical protein
MNQRSTFNIHAPVKLPPGFGLRQPSGAFEVVMRMESARGLAHSKTLPRRRKPFTIRDPDMHPMSGRRPKHGAA